MDVSNGQSSLLELTTGWTASDSDMFEGPSYDIVYTVLYIPYLTFFVFCVKHLWFSAMHFFHLFNSMPL